MIKKNIFTNQMKVIKEIKNNYDDIKIALGRIQSIINNLNNEKRELNKEKITLMKMYQELENKKKLLNMAKQKINYQRINIKNGFNSMNNLNFKYRFNDYNNNIRNNNTSSIEIKNKADMNKSNKKIFNSDEYYNNLMNSMKMKKNDIVKDNINLEYNIINLQ